MNKRNEIPISEKTRRVSPAGIKSRKNGPIIIPEMMYPIICGCLRSLIINEITNTIKIIRLR